MEGGSIRDRYGQVKWVVIVVGVMERWLDCGQVGMGVGAQEVT